MNFLLDPRVDQKLSQFERRRRRMLATQGLCAAVVCFLISMTVVAFVDWYWLLSDQARWMLSGLGYAAAGICICWMIVRRLLGVLPQQDVAESVELAEPRLREHLVSAVELAADDPASIHDSPRLRQMVQAEVAEQMEGVQISRLLPVRMLSVWLMAAAVFVLCAVFLLTSGGPRIRQLAVRALLPGANIARVSRIQIEVRQPTPHSLTLAENETVAVVVRTSGGDVDAVTLETGSPGAEVTRLPMRARSNSEYAANISVTNGTIEYRIFAGDGITQKYRIESRSRPQVTSFRKIYHYPDYAELQDHDVTENHGNLMALKGATAELLLELNQTVTTAELRLDFAGNAPATVIDLAPEADGRWRCRIPIQESSVYRVHLVASETGFENPFSPKYEIQAQPDLIPAVGFVNQPNTNLLLPPNEILSLQAYAEDDLPLVSLQQQIAVNGGEWTTLPLSTVHAPADPDADRDELPGQRLAAAWQWDLMPLTLKSGDQVLTRLTATDRRGQTGESVPIRIIVSAPEFNPDRHFVVLRKLELIDGLNDFSRLVNEHKAVAATLTTQLADGSRSSNQKALDRTTIADLLKKQEQQVESLQQKIQEIQPLMPAGADGYELDLVGRVLGRMQLEHSRHSMWLLQVLSRPTDEKQATADLAELKKSLDRLADEANAVAVQFQRLATHNFLAAVAFDLDTMLQQQKLVVENATQTWDRLTRLETIVVHQLQLLENLIRDQRSRLHESHQNQLLQHLQWMQTQRDRLQLAMESADKLPELQKTSSSFLNELQHRQNVESMDGGLPGNLIGARRDLENRSGILYVPLEQLARAIAEENRRSVKATTAKDSAEGQLLLQQVQRQALELDIKHRRSLEQLSVRRGLTQLRQDADAQYAYDIGLTLRAVGWVLNQHRQTSPQDSTVERSLLEIAPAWRTLEAGHDLMEVVNALNNLNILERWGSQSVHGRLDHPRQWDMINHGFELASQRLREARVTPEVVARFDQMRWSAAARDAGQKITERRWKRDRVTGAGHELAVLKEQLSVVVAGLQPAMTDARAVIARYAPTISEMSLAAAEHLRELEKQTTETADRIEMPTESAKKKVAAELTDAAEQKAAAEPTVAEEKLAAEKLAAAVAAEVPKSAETPSTVPDGTLATVPDGTLATVPDKTLATVAELQQQQRKIERELEDIKEALIDEANSQDVLRDEQREIARDADDSVAMIQEAAQKMTAAMEQAATAPTDEQQAKRLSQTAEQQERTAQTLETIAEHFRRLDAGADIAQTRAELRQSEQQAGIAAETDQKFEAADELSEMARQNAQELLSKLEAELQKNPAMQQALSEISRNALKDAQSALQYSANEEQQLQRANERSDESFQLKKKELTEDVHRLAGEAAELSRTLVAQAGQAIAQGKSPEGQQKLNTAQQKLQEAAAKAAAVRDDQLLKDLAETLQQTKAAFHESTEALNQARQNTSVAKDQAIHTDEKERTRQKEAWERNAKQSLDQQKKSAKDVVRKAEDAKRRTDQQVKTVENAIKAADQQVKTAATNLNRKPGDAGLQRNLAQAESRKLAEEVKLAREQKAQQKAATIVDEAKQKSAIIEQVKLPPLNAVNPAAEQADNYTAAAQPVAEALEKRAAELAAAADWNQELNPARNQLTSSADRQNEVRQDVASAASDIRRAARHEQRLSNAAAAAPLKAAAENIQQTADHEATSAQAELKQAEQAAPEPIAAAPLHPPAGNPQALEAQAAVAASEAAIAQRAAQLTDVIEPLLKAPSENAPTAPIAETGNPAQPAAAQDKLAQASDSQGNADAPATSGSNPLSAAAAAGQPESAAQAQNAASSAAAASRQPPTVEQLSRGRDLARRLDELDRRVAQSAAAAQSAQGSTAGNILALPPSSDPGANGLESLAQAAQQQQAAMAQARSLAQRQNSQAQSPGGPESSGIPSYTGPQGEPFTVNGVNRFEATEWGKLRSKSAKESTKGRTESVSEEYRKVVETYFRVLAERSWKKP